MPAEQELGSMTLVGEIIDAKCYYGVMKPGHLKPHRSCAVRCISGGLPPMLMVQDGSGRRVYFLLVSADGRAVNDEVLDLVAEPVEITGRVVRSGDLLVLKAICICFIEFMRGVPLITLLFVASTLLNYFLPPGAYFDLLFRVLIMVVLFSSAYIA